MLILASDLNSSPERCAAAPWPDEAKLIVPGLALASAISSAIEFAGTVGIDHQDVGLRADQADRDEILLGVVVQLLVERGVGGEDAVVAHQQRVAVGRRARDLLGGDVAAGAGPVLDDERLVQDFVEPLADDARQHVARAAGREGDERW